MSKSLFNGRVPVNVQSGQGVNTNFGGVPQPFPQPFPQPILPPGQPLVFPSAQQPVPAGPNAREIAVVSWDPDANILDVRMDNGMEAQINLADPTATTTTLVMLLGEGKLAAKVEIKVKPPVTPPKFTSVEEAEAWLEENG